MPSEWWQRWLAEKYVWSVETLPEPEPLHYNSPTPKVLAWEKPGSWGTGITDNIDPHLEQKWRDLHDLVINLSDNSL